MYDLTGIDKLDVSIKDMMQLLTTDASNIVCYNGQEWFPVNSFKYDGYVYRVKEGTDSYMLAFSKDRIIIADRLSINFTNYIENTFNDIEDKTALLELFYL